MMLILKNKCARVGAFVFRDIVKYSVFLPVNIIHS
jgi:hypothetical protein